MDQSHSRGSIRADLECTLGEEGGYVGLEASGADEKTEMSCKTDVVGAASGWLGRV